jgi:subtilisin family serine protease
MRKRFVLDRGSARPGPVLLFSLLLIGAVMAQAADGQRTWFFFHDKGPVSLQKAAIEQAASSLSEKALLRRARVKRATALVDETDLPVYPAYLEQLADLGIQPVVISRWLNGVSAVATPAQIAAAGELDCIARIQPVLRGHKPLPAAEPILLKPAGSGDKPLDYGFSREQNEQVQIPAVHQRGYYGQGVCIAVFDTGFRLNHEAFDSLQIIAKHDFIQDDDVVDNEAGERSDQNSHGTMVLSIIAANRPGSLIGGAPRATFILAKTEDVSQEVQAEEDHWIAAAEWAEKLGADIFSTSLGYIDWYTIDEMDGDTAPITRAADLAAGKGVVVLVSAGNEGNDIWRYISAPADGDSVIAVGAVDSKGSVAPFSSRGPTADGRIKPDVMAQGISVACVSVPLSTEKGSSYSRVSGTSAACPIAASCAALILCANPDLTPMEILDAMRRTATRSQTPDVDYGWGVVQTLAAVESTAAITGPVVLPEKSALRGIYPNPAVMAGEHDLTMAFDLHESEWVDIRLYDILGREAGILFQGRIPAGTDRHVRMDWPATVKQLGSGLYFAVIKGRSFNERRAITLLHGSSERR